MIPPDWKDAIIRAMRGDFGPPGESLRSDIMDELADHLSESMKREERAGRNEVESRERVLKRFGSPSQIAARLWFDGMKGSIMFHRWMMGVSAAALLLAFVAVGFAFWMVQENNRALLAAVKNLENQKPIAPPSMEWSNLRIKCVDVDSGEPMENVSLTVSGQLISTTDDSLLKANTDKEGRAEIGYIRVGKHALRMATDKVWISESQILVRPGDSKEVTIRCPNKMAGEPTKVKMRLPDAIKDPDKAAMITLKPKRTIDDRNFEQEKSIGSYLVTGNGQVFEISTEQTKPATTSKEVKLPAGEYHVEVDCYLGRHGGFKASEPAFKENDGFYFSKPYTNWLHCVPGETNEWIVTEQTSFPPSWVVDGSEVPLPAIMKDADSSPKFLQRTMRREADRWRKLYLAAPDTVDPSKLFKS